MEQIKSEKVEPLTVCQILNSVVYQLSDEHPFGDDLWEGYPIKYNKEVSDYVMHLLKNVPISESGEILPFRISDLVKELELEIGTIIIITHFMLQQKLVTKTNKLFTTQSWKGQIDSREIKLTNKGQVLRKVGSFDKLSRGMKIDKFYKSWIGKNTITIIGKIRLGLIKVLIIHQKNINKLIEKLTTKP